MLGRAGSKIGRTIEIEAARRKHRLQEYANTHIMYDRHNPDYMEDAIVKVSAAEMQKQFGAYSETAQREPVTITKHGRDSLVLLSVADYERLKSFDTRRAYRLEDAPQEFRDAIMKAEAPAWTAMYNHELDEE